MRKSRNVQNFCSCSEYYHDKGFSSECVSAYKQIFYEIGHIGDTGGGKFSYGTHVKDVIYTLRLEPPIGVRVIDFRNPRKPQQISQLDVSQLNGVASDSSGRYLIICQLSLGISIYDFLDFKNPLLVYQNTDFNIHSVVVDQTRDILYTISVGNIN